MQEGGRSPDPDLRPTMLWDFKTSPIAHAKLQHERPPLLQAATALQVSRLLHTGTLCECMKGLLRLSLTSVSSCEREKENPAAQKRLGMGASAFRARRDPFSRSMPSGPKWLAHSSVGLSSAGICASWPCPCRQPMLTVGASVDTKGATGVMTWHN